MFVDKVKIRVQAGDGGDGCISFRREKHVPRGGPNGGDGGDGGSIYLRVSSGETTLTSLHSRPFYRAESGTHGQGNNKHGHSGKDICLNVPPGTIVFDEKTGEKIGEMIKEGEVLLVARGGRGGKGNSHFASARRRAPRIAQPGNSGEERELLVELKLVAQGGLVGLPNAGKSTLLRRLTRAHPRIADYPFTTLYPVLGTFSLPDGTSLILADIPGIIQGAHDGIGLGLEFLRHIERTEFLIFVLDLSSGPEWTPLKAYKALEEEIKTYNPEIIERAQVLVFNKVDMMADAEETKQLVNETLEAIEEPPENVFVISAEEDIGLDALKKILRENAAEWLQSAQEEEEELNMTEDEENGLLRNQTQNRSVS